MASGYPAALPDQPGTHGDLKDDVLAIAGELGLNPAGTAATVAARLDAADAALSAVELTPGPEGPAGPEGPQGPAGFDGATGPEGPQGPQGIQGETGPQGPAGTGEGGGSVVTVDADGTLVVDGVTVELATDAQLAAIELTPGPQGETGPAGPEGPQGIQGVAGPTGPEGPQGIQGETGPAGADGADGTGGGTSSDLTDLGFDIVLLVGQSNMEGATGGTIDTRRDPAHDRVFVFQESGTYAGVIAQALDPLTHTGGVAEGLGPGLPFGRWYADSLPGQRRVLLVPCAVGATAFGSGTQRWDTAGADDLNNLYERAIDRTLLAVTAAGENARISAVLWHQGESDASQGMTQTAYRTHLEFLIDGLRARLGVADLPFLIGQMVPDSATVNELAITAAHQAIPTRKPFTAFVAMPTGLATDLVHYNQAGARELGRRYAATLPVALANSAPANEVPANPPSAPSATAPGQVTGLTGTPSPTQVALTWTAPASNGGSAITDYVVEFRTGASAFAVFTDGTSTATSATVTGLTNGTAYDFRVSAVNAIGTGTVSATFSATPTASATAPAQVGTVTPTAGNGQVTLAWTAPSNGGSAITDYVVQFRTGAAAFATFTDGVTTSTGATVTGLTNGTSYDFQVAAVNAVGTGAYSATATASPAAPVSASITDDFNRADNPTSLGTTTTGQTYQVLGGTFGIIDNRAYTSAGNPQARAVVETGMSDGIVQFTLPLSNGSETMALRATDANNLVYVSFGTSAQVWTRIAGVNAAVGGNGGSVAAGSVMSVEMNGPNIVVKKNGVTVVTTSTTHNQTATKHGFGFANNTAGRIDDFSVNPLP